MNDSLHPLPEDPPAEPLRDALHAAAGRSGAEQVARGYRIPERAVRSRARRRRAARLATTGTLSLALLAAAGVAIASYEPREPTPPAYSLPAPEPTSRAPLSAHASCGQDPHEIEDSLAVDSIGNLWVTLRVEDAPQELAVPVGAAPDLTVILQNRGNPAGDSVHVVSTEGPVFLALDDFGEVVGYARLEDPITPVVLEVADSAVYSGFGPLRACPGAPHDEGFLAVGEYGSVIVQSFDEDATPPFDALLTLGDIVVGSADGEASPRAGECRSSLDALSQGSGALSFDELQPVLVTVGHPFDPDATLTNRGPRDVADPAQGGLVMLVVDEQGLVVALSRPVTAVPGTLLAGESHSLGAFEALTDCVSGEALEPGGYQFHLARLVKDPTAPTAVDLLSWWGSLAVTDDVDATRTQVELPTLPVCGEPVGQFTFDAAIPAGRITYAGFSTWSEELGHVDDPVDGHPTIEFETTHADLPREVTFLTRASVLVRDGVVVATEEMGGWGGAQPELWATGSTQRSTLGAGSDCAAEEDYTPYEPEGRYTIIGFAVYDYTDEFGLSNYEVVVLGPVKVDFGSR